MDVTFASQLARHFGFPHTIVDLPCGSDFAQLDGLRRTLVDGEGVEHTWWAAMGTKFKAPVMLFDGLVGDVTAYSFYDTKKAAGDPTALVNILNPSFWPPPAEIQKSLDEFLADIPSGKNHGTLGFLLLRTRSGPGLMATRLLPLGNLAVFPFMDLDYFWHSLRFDPGQKMTRDTALQHLCLSKFWPEYLSFPTTRNPPNMDAPFHNIQQEQWASCLRRLYSDSGYASHGTLSKALTPRARALVLAAQYSTVVSRRIRWWIEPFLTLAARLRLQQACWTYQSSKDM
jgi:hypothetical protein